MKLLSIQQHCVCVLACRYEYSYSERILFRMNPFGYISKEYFIDVDQCSSGPIIKIESFHEMSVIHSV